MSKSLTFAISVPIGSYHPVLESCLASLAAQNVRLNVAVLDASGDARVHRLVDKYDHAIAYRFHGPDGGQTDAIMKGWQSVEGDILGWLNADDVLAPDALARAAEAFATDESRDVVFGHSLICDDDGYVTGYHWNVMPPGDQILSTCSISQPSCFFKRSALDAIGGLNRDLHFTMDWDLWIRLYKNGARFHLAEQIRSLVLWSAEAKTGGFGRARRAELKRLLDEHAPQKERWNSYIGFATQYLYEYLLPRPLRNWIWRRNISGGQGMFGLNVAGDIATRAEFGLFHYDDAPKTRLELKTESALDSFQVHVNDQLAISSKGEAGGVLVDLPVPLAAREIGNIQLQNCSEKNLHLRGIRLF